MIIHFKQFSQCAFKLQKNILELRRKTAECTLMCVLYSTHYISFFIRADT